MTAFSPSPGQAAKAWADRYPSYSGRLLVLSYTPAGRGGWKTKIKRSNFLVHEAKATALVWRRVDGGYLANGRCEICGAWFVKPGLQQMGIADPEAGQEVPPDRLAAISRYHLWIAMEMRRGQRIVYGQTAIVDAACADCIASHHLVQEPGNWSNAGSETPFRRVHPLCRYPSVRHSHGTTFDISGVQTGRESLDDAVTRTPPEAGADAPEETPELSGGTDA